MSARHRKFLNDHFHAMVLQATMQRATIYEPGSSERARALFRGGLQCFLDDVAPSYSALVSDETHIERIVALASTLTRDHSPALQEGRFRLGPAQKALNLFLKYQWCSGWIAMPPHCAFDARIIRTLPSYGAVTWTRLDSVDLYRHLVAAARFRAADLPLAEWELREYGLVSEVAKRKRELALPSAETQT